jgi:hypothetical protein
LDNSAVPIDCLCGLARRAGPRRDHQRSERVRKIVEFRAKQRLGFAFAAAHRTRRWHPAYAPQVEKAVAALEHGLGGYAIKARLTRKPIEGIARRLVSSP